MGKGLNFQWKKESGIRSWQKFNEIEFKEKFTRIANAIKGLGEKYFEDEVRLCTSSREPVFSIMITGAGDGFATWKQFEVTPCVKSLVSGFDGEMERICADFESQFTHFKQMCSTRGISV